MKWKPSGSGGLELNTEIIRREDLGMSVFENIEQKTTQKSTSVLTKRIAFKIFILTLLSLLFCTGFVCAGTVPFKTEWTLPNANITVKLPIPYHASNDFTVDWGDGSSNSYTTTRFPTHKYTSAGTYTISITGTVKYFGHVEAVIPTSTNIYSDYYSAHLRLTKIVAWGDIECIRYGFSGCSNLTGDLPSPTGTTAGVKSFENLISMRNMFRNTNILSVPDDFFKQCTKVTNMSSVFYDTSPEINCWEEDMFSACTEVTTFTYMFRNNDGLNKDITDMDALFANNTKVTSFAYMFYDAAVTGQLPGNLFATNTAVTNFTAMFGRSEDNKDLVGISGSIPEELFANNTKVTNMSSVFLRCGEINGTIPENLFANCPLITRINYFFNGTSITGTIPENLFANNPNITTYAYLFEDCTKLTGTVPKNLFASNEVLSSNIPDVWGSTNSTTGVEDAFRNVFKNCSGLEAAEIDTPYIGYEMFYGCNSLTNITLGSNIQAIGTDAFEAIDPYNADNLLATTVTVLDESGAEITEGLTWNKTYGWTFDNRLVDVDINVNTIGDKTVDITNFEKNTQMIVHTCTEYEVNKFDETQHWSECSICGNILNSKTTHTFDDSYWTLGTNTCSSSNTYRMNCDCGYYVIDTDRAKPKSHTTEFSIAANRYSHYDNCTECGADLNMEFCEKSDGTVIDCNNLGTCVTCGQEYTKKHHYVNVRSSELTHSELRCQFCNVLMVNEMTTTLTYTGTTSVTMETVYTVPNGFTFDRLLTTAAGQATLADSSTSTAYRTITVNATFDFNNSSMGSKIWPGVAAYWTNSSGEQCYCSFYTGVNPDTTAPTVNITQEHLAEYNGWVTQPRYTVSGTENYCKSVTIELIDQSGENVYNVATDVTSNAYSYTFSPTISSDIAGGLYQIVVSDTVGNSTAQGLNTNLMDNIAPEIIYTRVGASDADKGWTKEKEYKIIAIDSGTNVAELMLQSGDGFVDEYGVTTINNSLTPTNYIRTYTFTGNVDGTKEIAVLARDEANNQVIAYLEVSNLDNTAPVITLNAEVVEVVANINLQDSGSGIKYFAVIPKTSVDTNGNLILPTEFGTEEVTTGNTLNYWYAVKNLAVADADGNVPASEAENIDVTFAGLETGEYYILAQDLAGNVSYQEFSVDTSKHFITEWTIPVDADGTNGTTSTDADGNTITLGSQTSIALPILAATNNSYTVDWGDGTSSTFDSTTNFPIHTYTNTVETVYTIKISGIVNEFGYTSSSNPGGYYILFTQYLTGLVQWGEIGATQYGFSQCKNLKGEIPEPSEQTFTNVVDCSYLFYGCTGLTGEIPEKLFQNGSNITSFGYTFAACTGLTGIIPENLFANNESVESFEKTFVECTGLTGTIPENLFANNANATNFNATFSTCTGLTGTIPENLFINNVNASGFNYTFAECTGLSGHVSVKLFENAKIGNDTEVALFGLVSYSVHGTFYNCSNLTSVEYNKSEIGFGMFYGCNNLTDISIGDNVQTIGTDAFEATSPYSQTNLLHTKLTSTNSVATNYDWIGDYRAVVDSSTFIMEWTIPVDADGVEESTGIPATIIKLPIPAATNNSYAVNWGDGTIETFDSTADFPSHAYTNTEETVYTITIRGTVNSFGYVGANIPTTSNDYSNYYTFTQYLTGLISWGELNATRYGFALCQKLSSTIPEPTENTFNNVTDMENLFYQCIYLNGNIPSNLFASATNVVSFKSTFENCASLTGSIPEDLFANTPNVVTFWNTFSSCRSLTGSIPENLFSNTKNAAVFYGTFSYTNLSGTIPAKLFASATNATSFQQTFLECMYLTGQIPEDLFANNINAESFKSTFSSCVRLTGSIPENLFANNVNAQNIVGTFNYCTGLTGSIPENLFKQNTNVTSFASVFEGCSGLSGNIPKKLFLNNEKATAFSRIFKNCTGLTGSIPEKLFVNSLNATNFKETFLGCTNLTGIIPADLFKNNTQATTFTSMFEGCSSLTGVELQLTTTESMVMDTMFSGCTSLESIVIGENVKHLSGTNMFQNCSALSAIIMLNDARDTSAVATIADSTTLGLAAGTVFYVPYTESELIYEEALSANGYGTERIEKVVKAIEPNPDYVGLGEVYVDPGYTVAGFAMDGEDAENWQQYGFFVVVDGMPVDTSEPGSEWINYSLQR